MDYYVGTDALTSRAIMNPFTQDPVTHPTIAWTECFATTVYPFRIRPQTIDPSSILILGMNGIVYEYSLASETTVPFISTGGYPTDITVIDRQQTVITDVSWNNVLVVKEATVNGLMEQDSGIHFPLAIVNLNGYVYFSDYTGLYSFSSEGLLQKVADQPGITSLAVVHQSVLMAVNGENVIKCLKPGYEPTLYCSGFYGSFRLVDMCAGPYDSLFVVTESVYGGEDGKDSNGFLYVISYYGIPTACVNLPGIPQSICFVDDKILLALADSKSIFMIEATSFL